MKKIFYFLFLLSCLVAKSQEVNPRVNVPYWWITCLTGDVLVAKGRFTGNLPEAPNVRIHVEESVREMYFGKFKEDAPQLDRAYYSLYFQISDVIFLSKGLESSVGKILRDANEKKIVAMAPSIIRKNGEFIPMKFSRDEMIYVFSIQPVIFDRDFVLRSTIEEKNLQSAMALFDHLAKVPDRSENAPDYKQQ